MLKLYKKTISITSIVAVGCLLLSVVFEFLCFPHYNFLINIFIGTFCSLIVVVITTILQYRAEHSKVFKDYSNALRLLIFNLSLINDYIDNPLNEKQYEYFYEEFDKLFFTLRECNDNLVWFSKSKRKLQETVFLNFSTMYVNYEVKGVDSHKNGVDVLIGHKNYQKLIDASIVFLPDGFDKKFILNISSTDKKEL